VLTADCGPVLFADPRAGVIGAAHAGWKGALTGVTARTLDAMEGAGGVARAYHRRDRADDFAGRL
jgi:polyphenol oxidase